MNKQPSALPEFQRYQFAFTAHIRDPKAHPRPAGVDARRMKIYNELLYNNVEGFLLACFPVLRKVLGVRKWAALVRAFFSTHRSHTPYFRQIPDEFIQYLQAEWQRPDTYPEYVLALAHYEWIELALSVSTRAPDLERIMVDGDLLKQRPVLNPVLANLYYSWPVQQIQPHAKIAPVDTYLLVFRDADDGIQFIGINAFTARLLNLLEPGTLTGRAALERVAVESAHTAPEMLIQGGLATMQTLRARGAILGVASA
ncbi:MAG: putative DNA-binding domain-containing protein [Thiobacillaceae bacterium]